MTTETTGTTDEPGRVTADQAREAASWLARDRQGATFADAGAYDLLLAFIDRHERLAMASASADGLNIDEAVKKACEEPTLAKALAWIAIWESERVVRFVLQHQGQPWDTCFRLCFERVLERYTTTHGAIPAYDRERQAVTP